MLSQSTAPQPTRRITPPLIRVVTKIDFDTTSGCWQWLGAVDSVGYSSFRLTKTPPVTKRAHRWLYELIVGPIPAGLVLDHLCRNKLCVNPDHLEPVTNAENLRRYPGYPHNRRRTHCPQGHPYSGWNLIIEQRPQGFGRHCRECKYADTRRRRATA